VGAVPIIREERIPELQDFAARGQTSVLHLHWLNLPLADATSAKDAAKLGDAFLRRLDVFKDAGGRLAWTIHNILPHGSRFDAEEARMRAAVAERADVLHVMAAGTADYVRPYFAVPEAKLLHVPHPSYAGAYESYISRDLARHELGIMPDEIVFAVVGAIRPYKGLTDLLDAWDRLPPDRPRRLLIAGGPTAEPGIAELIERAVVNPSVLIDARKIPAAEMQLYLQAADVAVLPYLRSLNSGALMLAVTFGLPVIVPDGGGLAELAQPGFGRTYAAGDVDALAAALASCDDLLTPAARAAALAFAAAHDPADLSRRFATGLRQLLDA
jgi:glycosyltransferase involved in cell wall biosynthesis